MSNENHDCHKLDVPLNACLLRFGRTTPTSGDHIGDTVRHEMVIAHYDAAGHIVELELVADDKRCQTPSDGKDERK